MYSTMAFSLNAKLKMMKAQYAISFLMFPWQL